MLLSDIIVRPLLTEKVNKATEKNNVYGFEVGLKANKNQIKNAIQELYNVKVLSISTSILPGKVNRTSKGVKKSSKTKKAYLTIANDQKIQLFSGI